MGKTADFIPGSDADFFIWEQNYVTLVSANAAAWGISPLSLSVLTDAQTIYEPFYNAIKNPSSATSADRIAHRQQRIIYEKVIRKFNKEFVAFNSKVTTKNKSKLRITVPDETPSVRPKITDSPFVKLESLPGAEIGVRVRRTKDSTRASMHPDADEIEVRYSVSVDPGGWENCTNTATSSKARFELQFSSADIGKRVYIYCRWKNKVTPSLSGPWTSKQSCLISD